MPLVQAELFFVEAGVDRKIHEGFRHPGDLSIARAGIESCNLDDAMWRQEVSPEVAEAAIADGRGCGHCIRTHVLVTPDAEVPSGETGVPDIET